MIGDVEMLIIKWSVDILAIDLNGITLNQQVHATHHKTTDHDSLQRSLLVCSMGAIPALDFEKLVVYQPIVAQWAKHILVQLSRIKSLQVRISTDDARPFLAVIVLIRAIFSISTAIGQAIPHCPLRFPLVLWIERIADIAVK